MSSSINLRYTLLITSAAALGGLLFGFDIAIITGAAPFIQEFFVLGDLGLGWAVSALLWGCIPGAILAGKITDTWGRKSLLMGVAFLFIITSIATGMAPNITFLVIARFFGGFAVGAASIVSPLYISEISPPGIRGRLVALYQLSIVTGILLSYLINYMLHDIGEDNWRWMFISGTIPSLLFFVLLFFVPETPRYLYMRGDSIKAFEILSRIGGKDQAGFIIRQIGESLQEKSSQFSILFQPGFRRMMWVGFGLAVFVQISGINTIIDYAPIILKTAGWKINAALFSTFIIGSVNFLFTLVSLWAIDKFGRRPLYLAGSAGMALMLAGLTVANLIGRFEGPVVLIFILIYIAFFAACIGPVFWTLVSEIFPNRIRGVAMSVPVFTQWVVNALVVLVFPWMLNVAGGSFTFGFLAIMAFLMFLFTFKYVPETRGKSLEDIEKYWLEKNVGM
jgi:SP family arabinose:H+ symporter-like MFS transporter